MKGLLSRPYMKSGGPLVKWKPDASTVLWLPGQSDAYSATIRDYSGKGNNGDITGATWNKLPSGLWVLYYVTDDYTTFPDVNILPTGTSAFTEMFWAKHNTQGDGAYWVYLRLKQTTEFVILSSNNNGGISAELRCFFRTTNAMIGTTLPNVHANVWAHYAIAYNGGDKSLTTSYAAYINAVPETFTQGDVGGGSSNANVIGNDGAAGFYGGYQALHRAMNRVVGADEIASIYNSERSLLGV